MTLRKLSISKKIVAFTMIVSAASLLVAGTALVTYDYAAAQRDLIAGTEAFARVVAANTTGALSFNDRAAAVDTLTALHVEPSIVEACLYTKSDLFAEYRSSADFTPCSPHPDSSSDRNTILVTQPIDLKGARLGIVQLHASLASAYAHFRVQIATIAGIFLLSGLFALGLAALLHKLVSKPILSLAKAATDVSVRRDYSVRASKETEDELGTLVDAFNDMLAQIQTMLGEIREREQELQQRTGQLAEANEELQKANKMKDEFLATLSHELRTPLTAIVGWITLLKNRALDEAGAAKAINVIERNVKAQTQLVNDLLNVSQIITGKLKVNPEWIDVTPVLHAAADSIRPAAEAKGIEVSIEISDDAVFVYADPERLQQVLWNLLTNAVKFTDKNGQIRVECRREETQLQISVTDNGEGIEPEFMPFIFERFTQADASKTRKHGGLGLGLAISRHIIESHGGQILARSEGKGRGTSFIVRLPIPATRPESSASRTAAASSLRGLKVLIVEDELDTREMLAEGLGQAGAQVLLSASGDDALRLLGSRRPDVIVSDIAMPDMDGYEMMRRIRNECPPPVRTLPAIALTAFTGEEEKRRSRMAGYQLHLVKPVEMSDLVNSIAFLADRPVPST